MSAFRAEVDRKCQRGLHWRYRFDPEALPSDPEALDRLHQRLIDDPRIVFDEEAWGPQSIRRYILPFRFEIRLWTRPGELSFIHRATSPPDIRSQDRAAFDSRLRAWIEEASRSAA